MLEANARHTFKLTISSSTEHDRLEIQAVGLRALAGDKVIHAPLSTPAIRKALDIGCGTGVVTHELSSKYPNAQVYGIDLTPVPSLRTKLKNTEYIEGDVFKLADNKNPDPRFEVASFDYIFSRFLVMGMTEWKKYVELCASLTAPGVSTRQVSTRNVEITQTIGMG
jgi:ubiquinone/menaquinone biosynthesis C-methylase UbiE